MNAHTFTQGMTTTKNCFTLRVNLSGVNFETGISVNTTASRPGVYLTSDDSDYAWTRFIPLQDGNQPSVLGGKIFSASNSNGRLTSWNPLSSKECFLKIEIFDPQVVEIDERQLEVVCHSGTAVIRELVWKKKNSRTVGVESFVVFPGNGTVLRVRCPRKILFIVMKDGRLELLPQGTQIEQDFLRKEAADAAEAEAAALAKQAADEARRHQLEEEARKKREKFQAEDAASAGATFPSDKYIDNWKTAIQNASGEPLHIKEAFMGAIFNNIITALSGFKVSNDGRWTEFQVFQMHTLHEVCRHLPKEHLDKARKSLTEMSLREHAPLPGPIIAKFGMIQNLHSALPKETEKKTNVGGLAAAKARKAERAATDRKLRNNMKGSNQEIPLHPKGGKGGTGRK